MLTGRTGRASGGAGRAPCRRRQARNQHNRQRQSPSRGPRRRARMSVPPPPLLHTGPHCLGSLEKLSTRSCNGTMARRQPPGKNSTSMLTGTLRENQQENAVARELCRGTYAPGEVSAPINPVRSEPKPCSFHLFSVLSPISLSCTPGNFRPLSCWGIAVSIRSPFHAQKSRGCGPS